MADSILRLSDVKNRTGLTRTPIYEGIKAGTFPAPVQIGQRSVGWLESEVSVWIASRPKKRAAKAPAAVAAVA